MKRHLVWVLVGMVGLSLAASAARADMFRADTFEATILGGYHMYMGDQDFGGVDKIALEDTLMGLGRMGYTFGRDMALELGVDYVSAKIDEPGVESSRVNQMIITGNFLYHFAVTDAFVPYVGAGMGNAHYEANDTALDDATAQLFGGFKWYIARYFALRFEVRGLQTFDESNTQVTAAAGLILRFYPYSEEVQPLQVRRTYMPVAVAPEGCIRGTDTDGDGVDDCDDLCPDTPPCATVDAKGCPTDSDNDGVADGCDKCPNTPPCATVDETGCPLDGDGDGVADGCDKCPTTPPGQVVDANGCSLTEAPWIVGSSPVFFGFDKYNLTRDARKTLDKIAKVLTADKMLTLTIVGHTDSIGTEAYNKKLGMRRAKAAGNYLVDQGIDPQRIKVSSMGESKPAESNATAAGRAKNRRVEFRAR